MRVEGNVIVATGSHAAFNVAGMLLAGPVRGLQVKDKVQCQGPAAFQLTGLPANDFAGNAQGAVFGCP